MKHISDPTSGQQHPVNSHGVHHDAIEFKELMEVSINRSGLQRKVVALEMGVLDSTLSHWLSHSCKFTIPAHQLPRLCQLLNDDSLMFHLAGKVQP